MSKFAFGDDEETLPPLVPIKKKKEDKVLTVLTPSEKGEPQDPLKKFMNQASKKVSFEGKETEVEKLPAEEKRKEADSVKIKSLEKKFHEKTPATQKRIQNEENIRSKENQKSKRLIHEMLSKLSVQNITEELYPAASNEVINKLVNEIEDEIQELKEEIEKKENKLAGNESNKEANQEVVKLKKSVARCETIKELYHEKINYRNKIDNLEREIINLKENNKDLKIKITKGIQTIQNYKKNLPSDEEKELKEKLTNCQRQLKTEKEMRQNLQKNIQNLILNFKRLYDEADVARLIITKKLEEIQERQKKLNNFKMEKNQSESQSINIPFRKVPPSDGTEEKKFSVREHEAFQGNQTTYRKNFQNEKKAQIPTRQKTKEEKVVGIGKVTMEEQIRKMRSNQTAFNRLQ